MSSFNILSMPFVYLISFFIVLTVIVFIHELGHFLVARWCGVKVETFSIGFGKEILGWTDRTGTRWKLCWILLGGYVKFAGDANAASLPSSSSAHVAGSLHSKPVWQRMAVTAAGPIANFLLAIVIFAGLYAVLGVPQIEPRIAKIEPGSAAERAGLMVGDIVAKVDGRAIRTFSDLSQSIVMRAGETVNLTVQRNSGVLNVRVVPDTVEQPDNFGGKMKLGRLGIQSAAQEGGKVIYDKLGPIEAVQRGAEQTWHIIAITVRQVGKLLTGREDPSQVGGLPSMMKGAGDAATSGAGSFAFYIAFLSISIGIINLFPIPMLDGGHLVYYAIESILGKPLSQRAQEIGFRIGLSLVFMLMAFGNWNDLTRIFAMIVGS
jgi:regulator of sigma E protease